MNKGDSIKQQSIVPHKVTIHSDGNQWTTLFE
jgi:hypothetical protein